MNKDIGKIGKKFTKDYQPDPKNKRVPKWKSRLKKLLAENYDEISAAIIDKCKDGDIRHIEFLKEWLYGKNIDKVETTEVVKVVNVPEDLDDN